MKDEGVESTRIRQKRELMKMKNRNNEKKKEEWEKQWRKIRIKK